VVCRISVAGALRVNDVLDLGVGRRTPPKRA